MFTPGSTAASLDEELTAALAQVRRVLDALADEPDTSARVALSQRVAAVGAELIQDGGTARGAAFRRIRDDEGVDLKTIAERFGIHASRVSRAVAGK
jgi:hypothetical protein